MTNRMGLAAAFGLGFLMSAVAVTLHSQDPVPKNDGKVRDAVEQATRPAKAAPDRPEARRTDHDKSDVFKKPAPISPALKAQPKGGRLTGFDFARDPLNADKPFTTFDEVMKAESAQRPKVMADHRKLLDARYNLVPQADPEARMARGKPLCVGPTARLPA